MDLKRLIRDVRIFLNQVLFLKDITPLLQDSKALKYVVSELARHYKAVEMNQVVGVESGEFILAPALPWS